MERINIAELLKDCPKGMELDCTMFDDVSFAGLQNSSSPIVIHTPDGYKYLNSFGCYHDSCRAKCVIFPKGKTTWEGFVPPFKFKDGDVIIKNNFIAIISYIESSGRIWYHCWYNKKYKKCKIKTDYGIGCINNGDEIRFATEDEKKKLFDAIRKNGYKWDSESKTLKKIEPRFKVGDRIKCAYNNNQYDIKELTNTHYILVEVKHKFKYTEPIINDKDWVLVHDKFDINTLKTFDQVLVRETDCDIWLPKLFSHYETDLEMEYYIFVDIDNMGYYQCIPYNGNEHLCRTTNNCDEFYKVWEK